MGDLAYQHPNDMRPPLAVARGMRITVFVRELVMHAMIGNPEDGAAFERHSTADCQEVFYRLGHLVRTMRQEPVISHSNAKAEGHPVQQDRRDHGRPAKEEQGRDSPGMENAESDYGGPVHPIPLDDRRCVAIQGSSSI